MTGYRPDVDFLEKMGVKVDPETCISEHNPETLETNVKGLYLAGSIVSGRMTNRIFIETGRFHGEQIFKYFSNDLTASGARRSGWCVPRQSPPLL